MPAPRTVYARSGDVHLAYQVIGEGPRDLVLVLDLASHLEALWEQSFVEEFVSSLARFARVLWFDMRGVGLSDRLVEDAVPAEEWMEDTGTVMDAAGSERATVIAHGHAAQMALLFAATHPDRVASLVCSSTGSPGCRARTTTRPGCRPGSSRPCSREWRRSGGPARRRRRSARL